VVEPRIAQAAAEEAFVHRNRADRVQGGLCWRLRHRRSRCMSEPLDERVRVAGDVAKAVGVPVLADAGAGFGEPLHQCEPCASSSMPVFISSYAGYGAP
jgi:hypothetical protein